eukprot:g23730.t1
MGVGRDIAALGAARGCSDFPEWNRCNASAWNCSRYQLEERCNETDDSDCEGITMELACKASCCLCGADNPASCGAQGGSDELPPWVIPVAAGGGSLLLCFFIGFRDLPQIILEALGFLHLLVAVRAASTHLHDIETRRLRLTRFGAGQGVKAMCLTAFAMDTQLVVR